MNKIRTLQIEFNLESLSSQLQGPAARVTSKLLARTDCMTRRYQRPASTKDTLSLFKKSAHAMTEVCVLFFAALLCL